MSFEPNSLKVARYRNQFRKKDLADLVGVNPRAITGFENGEYEPSPENLKAISRATGFPVSFFECDIELPENITASFRSLARMSDKKRNAALASASVAYQLCDWVDKRLNLPANKIPSLRGEDPKVAAQILRAKWGLEAKPIKNMIHLLESKGVRVFSLAEDNNDVDAFSVWKDETPFIFLNSQKSSERSRFDAAHELGHLLLHQHATCTGKVAESEADSFASAFLMPQDALLRAKRPQNLDDILVLKAKWKVSAVAMLYALNKAKAITQWNYDRMIKLASIKGWRKIEPSEMNRETSALWKKAQQVLRDNGLNLADACVDLNLPTDEVSKILFRLTTVVITGNAHSKSSSRSSSHLKLVE